MQMRERSGTRKPLQYFVSACMYKEKFLCAIENETKVKQIACQRVLSIISSCSESIIHFFDTDKEITT